MRTRKTKSPKQAPFLDDSRDMSGPTSLTDLIRIQDRIPEEKRVGGNYSHVSALVGDFCARREVLARRHNVSLSETASGSMRVVWALGRAAESHVRKQLAAMMQGNMYGEWECRCGHTREQGFYAPVVCPRCSTTPENYVELKCVDDEAMVTGSPDLIWFHDGEFHIVEVKSIKSDDFKALLAPKVIHVHQAICYVRLFRAMGHQVSNQVRVIYVSKDAVATVPYKEFTGEYDHAFTEMLWEDARAAKGEVLPPRLPVCSNAMTPTARGCGLCVNCFLT